MPADQRRSYLYRVQAQFAGCLLRRDGPGDADRARGLLDEAGPGEAETGMAAVAEPAAELLAG